MMAKVCRAAHEGHVFSSLRTPRSGDPESVGVWGRPTPHDSEMR